jgi:phage-related protein
LKPVREILFFGNQVVDFYNAQDPKVQLKIEYVLDMVRFERVLPIKFFKKLDGTNDLYEIRIITSNKSIRIMCFQDQGTFVVLTNAFVEKTKKTPISEIKRAERTKQSYIIQQYNEKH